MIQFNTVEEALEELKKGRIILVTDDPDREMRAILYVRQSSPPPKTLTSWRPTARA